MAVIAQPTKKPEWNTGGLNRTEPGPGEKTLGWVIDDEPPSSYFNWLQYYTNLWLEWINQRLYKGTNEVDVTLAALQPDAAGDGGSVIISAGAANGANDGGDVTIFAGNGPTQAGGRVRIAAADGGAAGGDVLLEAGDASSSGTGGDVTITGGRGRNGASGTVSILGTSPVSSGAGGDIVVAAGAGLGGSEGGDVTITAGNSADTNGGDVAVTAGTATGTDRQGGQVDISSGGSTGDQGGQVNILVAESGATGSAARTPETYISANGGPSFRRVDVLKYLYNDNSSDTTRGSGRIIAQSAIPSVPLKGDYYLCDTTDRLRIHDGVGYRNLSSFYDQPSIGSFAVNDTVQERAFTHGGGNIAVTVPANYLSVGSIIRIRAVFVRSGTFADEPGFRVRIGTHGTMGADPQAVTITSLAGGNSLAAFTMDAHLLVTASGGSGNIATQSEMNARASTATWSTPSYASNFKNTVGIATNAAQDFYPTVYWHAVGGGGQSITCDRFWVDII